MTGKTKRLAVLALLSLAMGAVQGAQLVREFRGSNNSTTPAFTVEAPWILDWRLDGDYDQLVALDVTLVANSSMRIPDDPRIRLEVVDSGFDAADDWIVEHVQPQDIVVTADVPLAGRCVKAGATVLGVATTGNPAEDDLLVTAQWTELGFFRDGISAIRALYVLLCRCRSSVLLCGFKCL